MDFSITSLTGNSGHDPPSLPVFRRTTGEATVLLFVLRRPESGLGSLVRWECPGSVAAMADEREPDDPSYDWLYTGRPDDGSEGGQVGPLDAPVAAQAGPDHTTKLPTSSRPGGAGGVEPAGDRTRMLPESGRRSDGGTDAPGTPASFGGVYPRKPGTPPPSPTRTPASARAPFGQPPTGPAAAGQTARGPGTAGPPTSAAGASHYAQPTTTRGGSAGQPPPGTGGPAGSGYAAPPQATPKRPSGSPPRRRRRVRWGRIVLALVAAWLLFLVVVPIYAWTKVSKVDAEPSGARPAGGPGTTYLLVGSDSRQGLTPAQKADLGTGSAAGQRTDTIILLHVSDSSGPNIMLSIPRDSYVNVPGHGMNKINSAYAFGGPKLLVQTVEQATGVRVDDYVEIGFTGVVDVVDAVGGITVCPKTSINDPKAGHLVMKAGCQDVNGHVALDYSRSRAFPLGDITRAAHQREVIAATGSKAASWQTIVFPWRYWGVNMAGASSVQVGDNVGPFAFARFAWAMAHSGGSGTRRCVVPFSSLGTSTSVGSVVEWNKPKANAIFHDISSDDTSAIHCRAQ
jgi:LCP family protein required for cell wall assembly